ncbi:MAG: hypothetical protein O2856_12700, partial [Planctomycetota bacterium]|nr:hypothetical protein [Planctomycetota bacterium]
MKLIRSISTLVLLGSVSWMLGCTADENTAGPGGGGGGSGVAGGAVIPHAHADAPLIPEVPVDDSVKADEPKADDPP